MPLYEYACAACGSKTTRLVRKETDEPAFRCRKCGSDRLRRLLSGFAVHRTEADRLQDLDARKQPDDSYYRDDRNIGLRAKKRLQELGVNLGDSLDEKIEKARTTKIDGLLED